MNLYKIYASVAILLALCTYESEAGLVLLLLIKIIMLKGAVFFGLPLALGSFLLGQGAGFFKGSLFGGYTALSAAYKYQQKQAGLKHKPYIVIKHTSPHHHHGWGWTQSPGWGWDGSAPVTSYAHHTSTTQGWGWTPKPSFLKKLTTIPSYWINKIRDIKRNTQQGWGWEDPGHDHSHVTHTYFEDDHHHVDPALETVADPHSNYESGGYSSSNTDGISHNGYQSHAHPDGGDIQNDKTFTTLMKAVELAQKQYSATSDYQGDYDHAGTGSGYKGDNGDGYQPTNAGYHSAADLANLENYNAYESKVDPKVSLPAPNPLLENFLERKLKEEIQNQKSETRRQEASQLIQMLREAYVQELVESLKPQERGVRRADDGPTTPLPDFIPFPLGQIPNSTTAKPIGSALNLNKDNSATTTAAPSTTAEPPSSTTISSVHSAPTPPVVVLSQKLVPPAKHGRKRRPQRRRFNPNQVNKRMGVTPGPVFTRNRRQSPAPAAGGQHPAVDLQALSGFTDDVKKFFLLVSLLDSDKCLQKLVCEVHTKPPTATLTPYESNIVVTFKVMSVLLPSNVEDATTNYRKAAKIGELSKNTEICGKAYPTCTYSTDEIIRMGNQVAATEAPAADAVTPSAAGGDLDAEGSEVQGQTVPMREITTVEAPSIMPQV